MSLRPNSHKFSEGVGLRPVYLGINTLGGVGIPGNVGLKMAKKETIFFVDGDDWIDHAGFIAARRAYEANPSDIMFANYQEYDETNKCEKTPLTT